MKSLQARVDMSFDKTFYHNITQSLSQEIAAQIDGFVQDCNIYIANALERLQSCNKPSK